MLLHFLYCRFVPQNTTSLLNVKCVLEIPACLFQVFTGGLSSYCLILMVVSFLQVSPFLIFFILLFLLDDNWVASIPSRLYSFVPILRNLDHLVSSVRSSSGYHELIEIRNPLFQIFQILQILKRKWKWKWKDPTCAIFLKSMGFKDIEYDIPVYQM